MTTISEETAPPFWEQNNPYALFKNANGRIRPAANTIYRCEETKVDSSLIDLPGDFKTSLALKQFLLLGSKCGCVNIYSSADLTNLTLCKKMYGDWIYLVFEERAPSPGHEQERLQRKALFFNEWTLSVLNDRSLIYGGQERLIDVGKEPFDKACHKLMKNGIATAIANDGSYISRHESRFYDPSLPCETNEEAEALYANIENRYFKATEREPLSTDEMLTLLFEGIDNLAVASMRTWPEPPQTRVLYHARFEHWPFFTKKYLHLALYWNIVGFGWLPLVFAKEDKNEMDSLVIESWEKENERH